MEYSLTTLNKLAKLKNLTLSNFVDELNLIGFEIDEIYFDRLITNYFVENYRVLIKIPSNREDLLTENFLVRDLSLILLFDIHKLWLNLKFNYPFLIKSKYSYYENYKTHKIDSDLDEILYYQFELNLLKNQPSPSWIQVKLKNAGIKITNSYYDLINLVNFEWGQNFNSYSLNSSNNNNLKLIALEKPLDNVIIENKNYALLKNNIVLVNDENYILTFLGYQNDLSSLNTDLTRIIIDGFYYDIHNNPLKINSLQSKISLRHLRKLSLENFKFAFQRLLTLFEIIYNCKINSKIKSINTLKQKKFEKARILKLKKNLLKNILGTKNYNIKIFQKAGLRIICETQSNFYFEIPHYRHDLIREIDIVEEYSRFIGYKNFLEIFPTKKKLNVVNNSEISKFIRQFFITKGFNEIITNPIRENYYEKDYSVKIKNPLSSDVSILRNEILSQLIQNFNTNYKITNSSKNIFEIGRVFKKINNKIFEIEKLAGIFQLEKIKKEKNKSTIEWFIAKGYIESFLKNFNFNNTITFEKIKGNILFFHPSKSILIKYNNRILGIFGELMPNNEINSSSKYSTYIFEFDLRFFKKSQLNNQIKLFNSFSKYPSIIKDLSVSISKQINFNELKLSITNSSNLLKKVEFFDLYFDDKIKNIINLGIRLEFQESNRTLSNEEIEKEIIVIENLIKNKY